MGRHGINVNALAPGWFPSDISRATLARHEARLLEEIPLHSFGGEHDLKGAIALLASPHRFRHGGRAGRRRRPDGALSNGPVNSNNQTVD